MDLLLQILIAITLIVLCLIGGAIWLWRTKIMRFCALGWASSILPAPARLQLVSVTEPHSRKEERIAKRQSALRELGFQELGTLNVTNVPGLRLFVMYNPTNSLAAMIEERDCTGTWTDVLRFEENGNELFLASNAHRRFHFHFLPGERKTHLADAPESELIQAALASGTAPPFPATMTLDDFKTLLDRAYARHMDAILIEGLDDAHVRRLLRDAHCGDEPFEELSDRDFAKMKDSLRHLIDNHLRSACAFEFVRTESLPASEWHRSRDRLLIIHDRSPLPSLVGRLTAEAFLTDSLKQGLSKFSQKNSAPRESFARLNNSLPLAQRYHKLGQVSVPVPADIYRAPLASSLT